MLGDGQLRDPPTWREFACQDLFPEVPCDRLDEGFPGGSFSRSHWPSSPVLRSEPAIAYLSLAMFPNSFPPGWAPPRRVERHRRRPCRSERQALPPEGGTLFTMPPNVRCRVFGGSCVLFRRAPVSTPGSH